MPEEKVFMSVRYVRIVDALNRMAEIFTSNKEETFQEVMSHGLYPLAEAAGINRVVIYRMSDKNNVLRQMYEWTCGTTTDPDRELIEIPEQFPVAKWMNILTGGECINGCAKYMAKEEADFLETFGVKSIFFVPIFTKGTFWGAITLEDHTEYRYFEEECLGLLRSAARLCANMYIRNEMEYKLIGAEELTRAIANASPFPYILFDEEFNALDCNDAALQIFKCPDKQYLIDHYWDKMSPEKQPDGQNSFIKAHKYKEKTLKEGEQIYEWLHQSLDGELIPMENALTSVEHKGKKLIISFKYDLRDLKKLMEDVNRQGVQLAGRLEQQEMISEISKSFVSSEESETLINEAIEKVGRYLGVSRALIYNTNYEQTAAHLIYKWCASDTLPLKPLSKQLVDLIKNIFPETIQGDDADVSTRCSPDVSKNEEFGVLAGWDVCAIICVPIYVEGRLWGFLSLEQCEKPREWHRNEISFGSAVGSVIASAIRHAIYNDRLQKALSKMTAASEAKSLFLSNMSHEMRTPLNTIIGMSVIGKNAADTDRKDYALSRIEEASSHLLGVINDVLDMAKIEANKLELILSDFSFEKMLKKAVDAICFRTEQKQQIFHVSVDGKIPHIIVGDDQRLTQVLINLLSNAVKFTPEGGNIHLSAYLSEVKEDIYTIGIDVTDTGIGISQEDQNKLFKAFEQADGGISRKFGGTGLGLVISKRIVEQMGGEISVESTLGQGSKFTFSFSAKRGIDNPASLLDPSINWETIKVLAVDDSEEILSYFSEIFKHYGVACDLAPSGAAALEMLEKTGGYDVYFVDWRMPGMDGIELTKRIKACCKEQNKKSVVIMISAAEWELIREEAESIGVDKYLMKPLFASDIMDCMNACLGVGGSDLQKQYKMVETGELEGCHILLVEDVEINREIVVSLLGDTGAQIDCAENGLEALQMVENNPGQYDLIFMDVQMPEMDGLEAARCIRGMSHDRTVPIVAMTANVFKEDIEKCLEAGMDDHVGKPIDINEVLNKIRRYRRVK